MNVEDMTVSEAIEYCYELESRGEISMSNREFECLIEILESGLITPKDLPKYGIK